jgi:GNAT superfamily N-acetyltransferase
MIREANQQDADAIVAMGERFHAASGYAADVPYNADSFHSTVVGMIQSSHSAIFVAESEAGLSGMIGVAVVPSWFNLECLACTELFWWVDPDHRHGMAAIRLIHAAEQWVRQFGATTMNMSLLCDLDPIKVDSLYRRLGYRMRECAYVRKL